MRYVKWTLRIVIGVIIFGLLHYTLPQHDIVRVVLRQRVVQEPKDDHTDDDAQGPFHVSHSRLSRN